MDCKLYKEMNGLNSFSVSKLKFWFVFHLCGFLGGGYIPQYSMEIRAQFLGVDSLLPPCGIQESNQVIRVEGTFAL